MTDNWNSQASGPTNQLTPTLTSSCKKCLLDNNCLQNSTPESRFGPNVGWATVCNNVPDRWLTTCTGTLQSFAFASRGRRSDLHMQILEALPCFSDVFSYCFSQQTEPAALLVQYCYLGPAFSSPWASRGSTSTLTIPALGAAATHSVFLITQQSWHYQWQSAQTTVSSETQIGKKKHLFQCLSNRKGQKPQAE